MAAELFSEYDFSVRTPARVILYNKHLFCEVYLVLVALPPTPPSSPSKKMFAFNYSLSSSDISCSRKYSRICEFLSDGNN